MPAFALRRSPSARVRPLLFAFGLAVLAAPAAAPVSASEPLLRADHSGSYREQVLPITPPAWFGRSRVLTAEASPIPAYEGAGPVLSGSRYGRRHVPYRCGYGYDGLRVGFGASGAPACSASAGLVGQGDLAHAPYWIPVRIGHVVTPIHPFARYSEHDLPGARAAQRYWLFEQGWIGRARRVAPRSGHGSTTMGSTRPASTPPAGPRVAPRRVPDADFIVSLPDWNRRDGSIRVSRRSNLAARPRPRTQAEDSRLAEASARR